MRSSSPGVERRRNPEAAACAAATVLMQSLPGQRIGIGARRQCSPRPPIPLLRWPGAALQDAPPSQRVSAALSLRLLPASCLTLSLAAPRPLLAARSRCSLAHLTRCCCSLSHPSPQPPPPPPTTLPPAPLRTHLVSPAAGAGAGAAAPLLRTPTAARHLQQPLSADATTRPATRGLPSDVR